MKKYRHKFELKKKSLPEKKTLVEEIKGLVDDNARYPQFTRDKIAAAYNSMGVIDVKVTQRTAHQVAAQNLTSAIGIEEENFDILLEKFGDNIDNNANGDETYYTDAKVPFYLPGGAARYDEIAEPENFSVTTGDKAGEADFMCSPVAGAVGYFIEYTLTPEDHASYGNGKTFFKSSGTLKNLPSGKHIFLRIKAEGTHAESDFSNIICEITVP